MAQWLTNPTRNHKVAGSVPTLVQWVNDPSVAVSCGVGCRRSSDPALLWLWRRPVAAALIRPLAWEPTYGVGAALKNKDKKKKIRFLINGLGLISVLALVVPTSPSAGPH